MITDGAGNRTAFHTYWPFGEETPWSDADNERMKFTGHERDFDLNLTGTPDYMHARYYSAALGRFLSVDPVGGDPHRSQSWNHYSYTRNNPVGDIDPDGRCEQLQGAPACSDATVMATAADPGFVASLPYRAFYAYFGSPAEKAMVHGDDDEASQIMINQANGHLFVYGGSISFGSIAVPESLAPSMADAAGVTLSGHGRYAAAD